MDKLEELPEDYEFPKLGLSDKQLALLLRNIINQHEQSMSFALDRMQKEKLNLQILQPLLHWESEVKKQIDILLGKEKMILRVKNSELPEDYGKPLYND